MTAFLFHDTAARELTHINAASPIDEQSSSTLNTSVARLQWASARSEK
jgi:hypothetical protein